MTSSGIKRGVATFAISALAVAGLPLFAGTASASRTRLSTALRRSHAPQPVLRRAPRPRTTAEHHRPLEAGAGSSITSVIFQYRHRPRRDHVDPIAHRRPQRRRRLRPRVDRTARGDDRRRSRGSGRPRRRHRQRARRRVRHRRRRGRSGLREHHRRCRLHGSPEPYTDDRWRQVYAGVTGTVSRTRAPRPLPRSSRRDHGTSATGHRATVAEDRRLRRRSSTSRATTSPVARRRSRSSPVDRLRRRRHRRRRGLHPLRSRPSTSITADPATQEHADGHRPTPGDGDGARHPRQPGRRRRGLPCDAATPTAASLHRRRTVRLEATTEVAATTYYYANATDTDPYEAGTYDKRTGDVTVTPYVPTRRPSTPRRTDGPAFTTIDRTSATGRTSTRRALRLRRLHRAVTRTRAATPNDTTAAQTLSYHWVLTPFDGGRARCGTRPPGEYTDDRRQRRRVRSRLPARRARGHLRRSFASLERGPAPA